MTPDAFRRWCERRGYSQAEAAEALGTTQATVSRWQSGVHQIPPPVARLIQLLDADGAARDLRR
jgi:transcriptional regulator with XRE-family HTH domain